ncbi:hypothetical protein Asp14428_16860 [Actinoplanes sp. NBRC 14428]|nr:hypothetical protein Asp14428_16860 [Actinoplanes sp. NBRC 14428]
MPDTEVAAVLSPAQMAVWVADQLAGENSPFTINRLYDVRGTLDLGALDAALAGVVARHEALRSVVVSDGGQPVQRVLPAVPTAVRVLDDDAALVRFFTGAWDPATPPVLRLAVAPGRHPSEHRLALRAHHLLCDGTSLGVILRDLAAGYRPGAPVAAPDPAPGFRSWLRARDAELDSDRGRAAIERWRTLLSPAPVPVSPPADRPRPAEPSHLGVTSGFALPAEVMGRLDAVAASYRTTTFTLLLAAVHLLIGRSAGADDVTIGVVDSGRAAPGSAGIVGMLASTAPVRVDLAGAGTVAELVRQVRRGLAELLEIGRLPFDAVLEHLDVARSADGHPLFRVIVTHLDERDRPPLRFGDAVAAEGELPAGVPARARTDLTVELIRGSGGLRGRLELSADRYEPATAARLAEGLGDLLTRISDDPGRPLADYGAPGAPAAGEPARVGPGQPAEAPDGPPAELVDLVAGVWQEVLGRPADGDRSFFELGGTSHGLVRMRGLLHRRGYDVPLIRLFHNPTVPSLAAYLHATAGPRTRVR